MPEIRLAVKHLRGSMPKIRGAEIQRGEFLTIHSKYHHPMDSCHDRLIYTTFTKAHFLEMEVNQNLL